MSERSKPPRIVIAGGGTGGHVLPAIAVIEEFSRRNQPVELLWIGSASGLEQEEAAARGIPFAAIRTGKLRRYIDLRTIPDAVNIPIGTVQTRRLLRRFKPDVVFSTGGFVSVPSVLASWRGAPVVTHEQTAILGLANRINTRFAAKVALSFQETVERCSVPRERIEVTGNPVRASLLNGDAGKAVETYRLDAGLPLVYVTGGARGASPLNNRIEAILPELLSLCQVIHQTGPLGSNDDFHRLGEKKAQLPEVFRARYHLSEYVREELADVYAAAALVVCRSGAGMVAELAMLGKPSILIPLPGSGGGEQQLNATVLGKLHAAVVLDQETATPERLLNEIRTLLESPGKLEEMGARARTAATPDATAKLADLILALARGELR